MDIEAAVSQIAATLYRLSASDLQLRSRITDDVIERYVNFAQQDQERLTCPICFLSKGRVSHMYPGVPRLSATAEELKCDFCMTTIPITLPMANSRVTTAAQSLQPEH